MTTENDKPNQGKEAISKKEMIYKRMLERQSEAKIVRRIVLIIAISAIIAGGALIGGGYFYIKSALEPVDLDSEKEKTVEIPIGSSVTEIGKILEDKRIIKDARVFKYYVKFKNEAGFMAGKYQMRSSMTMPEIIKSLKTGKVMQEVTLKITIPEGKQLRQISGIIAEKTGQNETDIFVQLNDEKFIRSLMERYPDVLTEEILDKKIKYPLEGYLFPATYPFYTENPSVEEIVTAMLDKTKEVLGKYHGQMDELKYSPHKLLTIASLIEEEATEKVDRDKIASVFYNRIKKGMPLQTDPTVLYAMDKHKDRVLYEDLKVDSPYNTYIHQGLPPGPIANSGTISIEAAIEPAQTDFYYFLATSSGEVIFTRTLEEHNREKAKHITSKNS